MTNKPPAGLTVADYDSIEAAVMETARGRWFLLEHDRRRREAEATQVLDAIARIERAIGAGGQRALEPPKQIAIAGPLPPMPEVAAIGERLQDIAWNMRERGFDDSICSAIEEQARLVRALAAPISPVDARPAPRPAAAAVAMPMAPPAPTASPAADEQPDPRIQALARIDRMPLSEKLALFV